MEEEEEDDDALMERWRGGDAVAGNALFARHFDTIYRFFEHKVNDDGDIEDLVQESFLGCVRGRDSFRGNSSFRTYLFVVARNALYGYWRKRAGAPRNEDVGEISIASLSTSAGSRMARREEHERLLTAMQSLPLEQQLLLELHYWEDLDAEALAAVFETAPATSRSRLFRARQALRDALAVLPVDDVKALDGEGGQRGARLLAELALRNEEP